MRYKISAILACLALSLFIFSCTKKVIITEDDGYQYYRVEKNKKVGVMSMDGQTIIPTNAFDVHRELRKFGLDSLQWFIAKYRDSTEEIYTDQGDIIISKNKGYTYICPSFAQSPKRTFIYFTVSRDIKDDILRRGVCDENGKEIIVPKYDDGILRELIFLEEWKEWGERGEYMLESKRDPILNYSIITDVVYICSRTTENGETVKSVYDENGNCIIPEDEKYTVIHVVTSAHLTESDRRWFYICKKEKNGSIIFNLHSSDGERLSSNNEYIELELEKTCKKIYFKSRKRDKLFFFDYDGNYLFSIDKEYDYGYDKNRGFYYINPESCYDEYGYYSSEDCKKTYLNIRLPSVPAHTSSSSSDASYYTSNPTGPIQQAYPFSSQSSPSSSQTRYVEEQVPCTYCHGKRTIVDYDPTIPDFTGEGKYCPECGQHVPMQHIHITCPSCKGKGYVTRMVRSL